jgi:hypothetical protein
VNGMHTSGFDPDFVPCDVRVDDEMIRVRFESGLEIATPVSRFPRLQRATPQQRQVWRLIGRGDGIHWPDVDEDISVHGLFSTQRTRVSSSIEEVPLLVGELYKVTRRLNHIFHDRPFTPDGHLVGSIGEVVAEYIYGLRLQPCSTPRIDAHTADNQSVQIKLTGENGTSYGIRWSSLDEQPVPDLLIGLKLDSKGFREIYNGPFPIDLLRAKKDQSNGQIALTLSKLSSLNPSKLPHIKSFDSLNRWFPTQLSDVA